MSVFHFTLYKFRILRLIYTHEYFHIIAMKTATKIVSRRCSLDEAGESNSGHLFSYVPAHILDYNFSGFGDDASECKRFIVSIQAIPV